MKRITRLLMCAAVLAGMAAQNASAVLFTNVVENVQGMGARADAFNTDGESYQQKYDLAYTRSYGDPNTGRSVGKAWIQFDLTSTWDLYGQSNLVSGNLWLWGVNGTSRDFDMSSLDDSAGLEGWVMDDLWWTNAPANLLTSGVLFETNLCYGGGPIWVFRGTAIDVQRPDVGLSQGALYISPDFSPILNADTDGLVTFMWGGYNNQNWWVGTNGTYTTPPEPYYAENGLPAKASPNLTLVFDVRVALVGGGTLCSGSPGLEIALSDTDLGVDYLLQTNGVYAGQTVSGTGSAATFGLQTISAVYTAVASNTTTTVTKLVPGTPTIFVPPAPSFTVQPASFVAATNSVAIFNVTAVGNSGGYAWYRNGIALTDDGHYSGTTTEQLMISPVLASDAATTADGYSCQILNACGDSASSTIAALTIQDARNLVWNGTPSNTWDIATTANWWLNTAGGTVVDFIQGDNVTLDDSAVDPTVDVVSPYLSPGTITFNASGEMTISGSGDISGPASSLVVNGPTLNSKLTIANENTFAGGTVINDGWLVLSDGNAINNSPITMEGTGFSIVEFAGNCPGINLTADATAVGPNNSSILGPITGAGKTLTLQASGSATTDRIFLRGDGIFDADIFLDMTSQINLEGGSPVMDGVISGTGLVFLRPNSGAAMNGANTYSGGTYLYGNTMGVGIDSVGDPITSGPFGTGDITFRGDFTFAAEGGTRTVGNNIVYENNRDAKFKFDSANDMIMTGDWDLTGTRLGTVAEITGYDRQLYNDGTGNVLLTGVLSDSFGTFPCGIIKKGPGVMYLDGVNTYTGLTTVDDGRLAGSGTIAGDVLVLADEELGGGSAAGTGTLTVNGSVTFESGGAFIRVNKPAYDTVSVGGSLANSGSGVVTVQNLGSALSPGDKFTIFNKPVANGDTMNITGEGFVWKNNLAVDGSIEVDFPIATTPTTLTATPVGGTNIVYSWPASHLGWVLQTQVSGLDVGLSTNWTTIGGTEFVTSTSLPIDSADPCVFYRLSTP